MPSLEEQLKVLSNKFKENPTTYLEEYIYLLDKLSTSYEEENKYLNSIMLRERAIRIIQNYYSQNKKKWANHFIDNLKKLSAIYKRCSHIEEARTIEEKVNYILEDIVKE